MPDAVAALMRDCLEEGPDKRPTCEEIEIRLKRIDAESLDTNQTKSKGSVSLFDIFPRHIAEALRDGRTPEAEHKDVVTIFFRYAQATEQKCFCCSSSHIIILNELVAILWASLQFHPR